MNFENKYKSATKGQLLYNPTYIKYIKKVRSRDRNWNGGSGGERLVELLLNSVSVWDDENVLEIVMFARSEYN